MDTENVIDIGARLAGKRQPCETCGEVWVNIDVPGIGPRRVRAACPHEDADYKRQQAEAERRASYDARAEKLGRLLPPRTYSAIRLEHVVESPANRAGLAAARRYVKTWDMRRFAGDGLIFSGVTGTNKTLIACAIANELERAYWLPVVVTVPELLDTLRKFGDKSDLAGICKRCDLLVLDELGVEKVTEWAACELFGIIDGRYRDRKPVIITTNLNLADLEAKWRRNLARDGMPDEQAALTVGRILSRLRERCSPILFDGPDQRGAVRQGWLLPEAQS